MGVCSSHGASVPSEMQAQHKLIEKEIYQQQKKNKKEICLLMLGAGGTGKSTFTKQMKIMFSREEIESQREHYIDVIDAAMIDVIDSLLFVFGMTGRELPTSLNTEVTYFHELKMISEGRGITGRLGQAMSDIWKNKKIQQLFEERHLYAELSSTEYAPHFFDKWEELQKFDYLPTLEDVLCVRAKTTGISEVRVTTEGTPFCFVDVGGQRTERRKWLHCFENVTAVIFFVALNDYYLVLEEDPLTNRMDESLRLFSDLRSSVWFEDKPVIIFFNKIDLLKESLGVHSYKGYDSDFCGNPLDHEEVTSEIIDKFIQKSGDNPSPLYHHVTCAVNTDHLRKVFSTVHHTLLSHALECSF